jgi:predicted ATP-grasp superfamily ATP-dependent carboligase
MHQRELESLNVRLNALQNAFRQIDAVVEQGQEHMNRMQQLQQTAQTEDQIKMSKAQNEMQIDRMLASSKVRNQSLKTASQIQTAQQKAQAKPIMPRQQLALETAQGNAMLSPVQPPPGLGEGMGGEGEEGIGEMPFE